MHIVIINNIGAAFSQFAYRQYVFDRIGGISAARRLRLQVGAWRIPAETASHHHLFTDHVHAMKPMHH